jgi:hypothetical protein
MNQKMYKELKSAIKEALDVDQLMLTAGEGGELRSYNKKVEAFLNETFEKADKLAEEGEELLRENYLHHPTATERKRIVTILIGYLRETRNSIGNVLRLRYLIG